MFPTRTIVAVVGLCSGLAACADTDPPTEPSLSPTGPDPKAVVLRWAATRLSIGRGEAMDVNNQGQVVGYHDTNRGTRAFIWQNGTLQNLGTLGGGYSRAYAINEAGQVVGVSSLADGTWHAFLWQNGTMQDLGALDDDFSTATAIDGNGRVVGRTDNSSGETRAFLWQNGRMSRLAGLDGESAATGIDNQGRIVGWYGDPQSARAFRWAAGTVTDLGTLGGAWAVANAIVGGKIVGSAAKANEVQRAFLWQNGAIAGLGALAGGHSNANAINALGQVVGWSQVPDSQPRAVIWRDGGISPIAVGAANDINRAGWVVGYGSITFPVLWRETTDPPPAAGSITVGTSYFLSDRNWTTDPAVDTVAVGTRVTWTWVTGPAVQHTVQSVGTPSFPSSGFLGGVGVTYSVTFNRAGTYRYNCQAHPGNMFGQVVVR
ncbi:MAG TPA: plastocyanin/azurin family copper-binding protein [Gemmatimonadales bacterium]|nr:plastocyanin/azurin family copper-binding protein [Gemmatimonadales bacterium]